MRILCIFISVLGLLLVLVSRRGWEEAHRDQMIKAEARQAITDLQLLMRGKGGVQTLPDGFIADLNDSGTSARDWNIVGVVGAVVFLSGVTGIFIRRSSRNVV